MKRYDERVLNALLDKYESSLLYTGRNQKNISISFSVRKSTLPEYFDETSLQYDVVHEQLLEAERRGLVELVWKNGKVGHILDKCVLRPERAEEIYAFLHRRPRREKEERILEICHGMGGVHPALDSFLEFLQDRIRQEKSVAQYVNMDEPESLERLCRLVLKVLNNREEVFLREFSTLKLNDSKAAEKELGKAAALIARFYGNGELAELTEEQVLEEFDVFKNPSWVMLKGCGRFRIADGLEKVGECIALETLRGGIGLSSQDIIRVRWDACHAPGRVLTVENLTSFYRWQEEGTLCVYLGGYHNKVKRLFLERLYRAYPEAQYQHFGDMDCGGFHIWRDLREKTGIPFMPRLMDCDTFLKYAGYGKELTEYDRKELNRMLGQPYFKEHWPLFELMLRLGRKVEQECVGFGTAALCCDKL